MFFISSSFDMRWPAFWTRTRRVSNAFGVSDRASPSRNSKHSCGSNRKGPNSYNCFACLLIGALIRISRDFQTFPKTSQAHLLQCASRRPERPGRDTDLGGTVPRDSRGVKDQGRRSGEAIRGGDDDAYKDTDHHPDRADFDPPEEGLRPTLVRKVWP